MGFEASYPGKCGACGDRIHPGDQINYCDGATIHAFCDDRVDPDEPRRTERKCPDCFMIHAGECM
jgi:hypothetical protein